jgi:hypothetical protein
MYSRETYAELIEQLKREGYRFLPFDSAPGPVGKTVLLRHDIDYSPAWGAEFARLNAQLGVSGTFCVQLRSPLYNLAAAQTLGCVEEMLSLGQKVALHFTFESAPAEDPREIATLVTRDFALARRLVPAMSPIFSWHNPSLSPGLIERCLDLEVPGLLNLYSRALVKQTRYFADSNWRYSMAEWRAIAAAGHQRMQLLFHPFQWLARGTDMKDVLAKTFAQVMREKELEFRSNHVFREMHPQGLPPEALRAVEAAVAAGACD